MIEIASSTSTQPSSRRISAHEEPSMYSITMKYWPVSSSWPESNTCTMLGCTRRAAAWASRLNRETKVGSSARCSASSLTATWRSSRSSKARCTVDIPPWPSRPSSRYRPPISVALICPLLRPPRRRRRRVRRPSPCAWARLLLRLRLRWPACRRRVRCWWWCWAGSACSCFLCSCSACWLGSWWWSWSCAARSSPWSTPRAEGTVRARRRAAWRCLRAAAAAGRDRRSRAARRSPARPCAAPLRLRYSCRGRFRRRARLLRSPSAAVRSWRLGSVCRCRRTRPAAPRLRRAGRWRGSRRAGSTICGRACSLTVLQALGERVRQARRADRRGGAGDVVVGAQERSGQPVEVEQQPRRARIAIARLADAARVDQPFAGGEIESRAVAPRLAGRELALAARERQRHVRMADEAKAMALLVQAQLGQQRREHVLPNGVARAGVVEADDALLRLRAQRLQEGEVFGRDHLSGPLRRQAGATRELAQGDLAGDGEVVVTGQAHGGVLARELHTHVRVRAIPHKIAEAPQLGRVAGGDRIERGLEGLLVAVDVRDDRDLHCCRSERPRGATPPLSHPPSRRTRAGS